MIFIAAFLRLTRYHFDSVGCAKIIPHNFGLRQGVSCKNHKINKNK